MTAHSFMWKDMHFWKDHVALECAETGRYYTYSRFRDACASFAIRLREVFRLEKGDGIAIILPNIPEFAIILMGAIEAGIIVTTINPSYTPDEIARQISMTRSKMIFGVPSNYTNIRKACEIAKLQAKIVAVKTAKHESIPQGTIEFYELIESKGLSFCSLDKIEFDPNDVCVMPFSSGTTGLPKGVMLTHRNIITATKAFNAKIPYETVSSPTTKTAQDTYLSILPFFHIAGLSNLLTQKLCIGCKLITVPYFKPEKFLNEIMKRKPPMLMVVPPILLFLANNPNVTEKHFDSIHSIICGAANLGELDIRRLLKKKPSLQFIHAYGLTETGGCTVISPRGGTNLATVGWPCIGSEIKICKIDDTGTIGLDVNEIGEILIRAPNVMKGYFNNPTATKEVITEDGWLKSGDIGYYDDQGYLYIKDRLKELIKVKGFQVAPAELEEILRDHPKVADAAVVGIPHPRSGEVPRAFIVRKSNANLSEQELKDYLATKVVEYKRLEGGVQFIETIPKTGSGKILRRELKKLI